MRRNLLAVVPIVLIAWAGFMIAVPTSANAGVQAAPVAQPTWFSTPTPRDDGEIIYEVQQGDSLYRIAAISGVSVEELAAMNGMGVGDVLRVGMLLKLGTGQREVPTIPSTFFDTATPVPPTPTPVLGAGAICVLLFLDENGNARLDEGELSLAGGEVSILDITGSVSVEFTTDENPETTIYGDLLGHCQEDLKHGNYNVSVAVPSGYNPTTVMNIPIRLEPGDTNYIEFGAQASSATVDTSIAEDGGRSKLLGIVGLVMLVVAGGLAYQAQRMIRSRPSDIP